MKYGEQHVKISDCDYEKASQRKWYVVTAGNKKTNLSGKRMYVSSGFKDPQPLMHRYLTDAPKGMVVDHINGDGLDNRRENLRICTQSENRMNANRVPHHNSSGTTGVCWDKTNRKWIAYIFKDYHYKHLGYYDDKEDAILARKLGEDTYFGTYAPMSIN